MIVEYIHYVIPAEKHTSFRAAYTQATAQLRTSPDCLGFELSACREEPSAFIMRIVWTSLEGHLEGFRNGPQFKEFLQHVGPFREHLQHMRHYDLVDGAVWHRDKAQ